MPTEPLPLPFPEHQRVAVVAPHPDDFDVIAITLRRLRERHATIELVVMTSGASGVDDADFPGMDRAAKAALREQEQRSSCAFFGLPPESLRFLRLAEDAAGHLADTIENESRLGGELRRIRPQMVFLPHFNDPNLAHQRTYTMASRCLRRDAPATLLFLNRDPKTIAMRADFHVVFNHEDADWKQTLLRHHDSQQRRNLRTLGKGLDDRILAINAAVAEGLGQAGLFAEDFEVRTATSERAPGWPPG